MIFKEILKNTKKLLALCAIFLSGCMANYSTMPASEVAEAVIITDSKTEADIRYKGPAIVKEETFKLDTDTQYYRIRGWRNRKTSALRHQLKVVISNPTGRFRIYNSAIFDNGQQAQLKELRRYERCRAPGGRGGKGGFTECLHEQTLGIPLSDDALRGFSDKGFTLKISSEDGHLSHIKISSNYIQGYLKAVDQQVTLSQFNPYTSLR